ncbi:secreted RxLR effector protein 161-like [Nicotiana tomentosiformis]|uniref:secreted RxLR effector protein 161-like n=1 Tax=Nicotiana tomentosiformis TaxID=4098 RepID=UPI00388CCA58
MISQQKYIKELVKRFERESLKTIDTPIATATRLDMNEPGSPVNEIMYRGDNFDLFRYVDVDYAGYLVDRKITSGMAHFLGSCLISCGTKKQNFMALSTAKVEYVAVASCYSQLLWIKQQLEYFGVFSDCVP